jgi:hypothetical protein
MSKAHDFAGPSEEIVEVTTLNGVMELVVDTRES